MNRYWLFGGEAYYASGGISDLINTFCSYEEATQEVSRLEKNGMKKSDLFLFHGSGDQSRYRFEWFYIFDTVSKKVVKRSKYGCYGCIVEDAESK